MFPHLPGQFSSLSGREALPPSSTPGWPMEGSSMRSPRLLYLVIALLAALSVAPPVAIAQNDPSLESAPVILKALPRSAGVARSGFPTSSSDTVWVGYSSGSIDPNKVGVG